MVPIEVLYAFLLCLFGVVGTARKFPLELGATVGFTAMLFSLLLGKGFIARASLRAAHVLSPGASDELVEWFVISAFIALWVVFMYVGQTLAFAGAWPPGRVVGSLLDAGIGLFNGWLVVGTWWHYSSQLGYPMQQLGWVVPQMSARAEQLVKLTPPAIVPEGYGLWIVCTFLVFLLALRVIR